MSEELLGPGPVSCTSILPVEMWEAILDHVDSAMDLINCYNTCGVWQDICRARVVPLLLLQKVISQLWSYFSYPELIKCRLVCRHWKELVDDTFSQEDWDWEAGPSRRTAPDSSSPQESSSSSKRKASVVVQGSVVRMRRDPHFLDIIAEGSPGHNPFLSRTLHYTFTTPVVVQNNEMGGLMRRSSFDQIACFAGSHVANLGYRFSDGAGMELEYLSCLFLHFPNLKRLKLHFRQSQHYFDSWKIRESESEVLKLLQELKNGIRLALLGEITVGGVSTGQMVVLPALTSFLIQCSPSLQKVTFAWEPQWGLTGVREKSSIRPVLASCAEAGVKTLLLLGWAESLDLGKLSPKGHWPLRNLTVRLELLSVRNNSRQLVRTFYDILRRFCNNLEELHIESSMSLCGLRIRLQPSGARDLSRRCDCNKCYNSYQANYRMVPEFQDNTDRNGVVVRTFTRLTTLGLPHGLLHPALFPGLMKTLPNLRQLRINDLKESSSPAVERPELVTGLVCELWVEAPPFLREIVVSSWGGRRRDYTSTRQMFQASGVKRKPSSKRAAVTMTRRRSLGGINGIGGGGGGNQIIINPLMVAFGGTDKRDTCILT